MKRPQFLPVERPPHSATIDEIVDDHHPALDPKRRFDKDTNSDSDSSTGDRLRHSDSLLEALSEPMAEPGHEYDEQQHRHDGHDARTPDSTAPQSAS
mmetsp:Transcript_27324/g.47154  ORF Transcript_27324/g.47154 Transcript_27324/m.47154 type:complete len:97 (+) Transcript_27324:17-307(+)